MGILNITPDSFYDGGKHREMKQIVDHAGRMLEEGATIIDLGAASTRPGAPLIDAETEQRRLMPALRALVSAYPDAIWSVDTYNSGTAEAAFEEGAHLVNDISAGTFDPNMFQTIARLRLPYIMMHIRGTPETMQDHPEYDDILREVITFFAEKITTLRSLGVNDIIIDPGFGFGKDLTHNYRILQQLDFLQIFDLPILAGLSRKSMINKVLNTSPAEALNGTTVLNTLALTKGAGILRVHDVKQAVETIRIFMAFKKSYVG